MKELLHDLGSSRLMLGFSELAKVTGMPEARLKNWSFGRPLNIRPSKVVGRSGIYTEGEVWKFVIADAMVGFGFSCGRLQNLLDALTPDQIKGFGGGVEALAVSEVGESLAAECRSDVRVSRVPQGGLFILPLRPLRERILRNIRNLQERS